MTALVIVGMVLGIILAIGWIVLPFAVIGTKPLLRELLGEIKKMNQLLEQRRPPA